MQSKIVKTPYKEIKTPIQKIKTIVEEIKNCLNLFFDQNRKTNQSNLI